MNERDYLAELFEEHRTHMRAVAYRMLGSLSEVDDAVQEAWLRLSRADTTGIDNLGGWLTTVVARVCLDMLRSRQSRREEPFTPDAPEPVATGTRGSSPEQEALLADSVGLALLVVLDRLTPAERLAFVLHDMFAVPFEEIAPIVGRSAEATRQLASRARRRVRGGGGARPGSRSAARSRRGLYCGITRRRLRRPARRPRSGSRGSRGHAGRRAERDPRRGSLGEGGDRLRTPRAAHAARAREWGRRRRGGAAGTIGESAPVHDREQQDHRDRGDRQSGAPRRTRRVDRRLTYADRRRCEMRLAGPLAARSPGLRLARVLEIECHCSADEILQGRLIDFVDRNEPADVEQYLFVRRRPLPLHWNERVYNAIDAWRAETGLDANSQFLIGPLPPRARRIRAVLDALMRQPTLRPEMFHTLYQFAKEQN